MYLVAIGYARRKHILTVTMSILKNFRLFQRIYFLVGLAPCVDQKYKGCVFIIPVFISILSTICVALLQFLFFYLKSFGPLFEVVNYVYFLIVFTSNVTAGLQCWFYKEIYQDIILRIEGLEKECNFKFSRKILYQPIKKSFIVKAFFIIGLFSISAGIVLGQAWVIGNNSKKSISLASLTILKELMCALAVLHFTLYVDIVRLFLTELNNQIRSSPISFFESTKISFLKDIKYMHMDIYLLFKQINNYFGWHLLFLMVHYLILITYNCSWIFIVVQSHGRTFSITGKFKVFLSPNVVYCYAELGM